MKSKVSSKTIKTKTEEDINSQHQELNREYHYQSCSLEKIHKRIQCPWTSTEFILSYGLHSKQANWLRSKK